MKILHCVESYYPAPGGMSEVVKQLSERLVKLGHEVTVATSVVNGRNFEEHHGVKVISFNIKGNEAIGISGEREKYESLLMSNDFDLITFFAAQQWATDVALPLLDQIKAKKVFVPTGFSGLFWPDYKLYFEKMRTHLAKFDMNVFLSHDYRDINFAKQHNISKFCVIPNGAAEDEFLNISNINVRQQIGVKDSSFLILHVGSFTSVKGHNEALQMFLHSGLKNSALLFIGNGYEHFKNIFLSHYKYFWWRLKLRLNGNKVVFGSFSREFTVAAYQQSDLFLFPSNIECSPIVLFECAAAKLPFLATDVGNSVEIAKWTEGGLILPTTKDGEGNSHANIDKSVAMLNGLYADPKKRESMSAKAFANWQNRFSWEKITKQYESLYLDLLK